MPDEKEKSIGAFWRKTAQTGENYWSGELEINGEKIAVVAFANKMKQPGERTPDIRLFKSKPLKGHLEGATPTAAQSDVEVTPDDLPQSLT